jgi:hypothetical protein
MAGSLATQSSRGPRTICLPIPEATSRQIIDDPHAFRRTLDAGFHRMPELWPRNFDGSQLMGHRVSVKQGVKIRRIILKDGTAYSIRPSFLMPARTARVEDVEGPLFLRKFGVPFWALAHVFGHDPMYGYRLECGLGRASVVATTVKGELPEHLLADEHPQVRQGQKTYIATTVADGCCLGAEPAATAGTDDLKAAYGVFKEEARNVAPENAPVTVSTDGWKWTQAAWKMLVPKLAIRLCFLHGWLKVRDRAKHLKEQFAEVSRRVWEAYHAPDRRSFAPRLRWLRRWATHHLAGIVLEEVLDLCDKRERWSIAYRPPDGPRTSNMLDRVLRGMNRYFEAGQHLHGSRETCRRPCRAWALLWDFTPWHPATTRKNHGWRCPAERLNPHRYHDCWLQNLLAHVGQMVADRTPNSAHINDWVTRLTL